MVPVYLAGLQYCKQLYLYTVVVWGCIILPVLIKVQNRSLIRNG